MIYQCTICHREAEERETCCDEVMELQCPSCGKLESECECSEEL